MDNLIGSPVIGQAAGGADVDATANATTTAPNSGGATQGVATPTGQTNEDRNKVEALQKKYEQDIAKLKSVFDKRDADLKKEMERKDREWASKLKDIEMRGMDEESRKKYEVQQQQAEAGKVFQQNQELQQALEREKQARDYQQFFLNAGVPLTELVVDSGPEELARSGWEALTNRTKQLQQELDKYKKGGVQQTPTPPDTLTHNSTPPNEPSITDLVKKYANGDEDKFYSMLEKGQLPTSILPKPKNK